MQARLAAHVLHSRVDGSKHTAPARKAAFDRFVTQVTAEAAESGETLTDAELMRRADHARKAYMTGLALRSSIARSRKKAGGKA